jgi:hypothetical protein
LILLLVGLVGSLELLSRGSIMHFLIFSLLFCPTPVQSDFKSSRGFIEHLYLDVFPSLASPVRIAQTKDELYMMVRRPAIEPKVKWQEQEVVVISQLVPGPDYTAYVSRITYTSIDRTIILRIIPPYARHIDPTRFYFVFAIVLTPRFQGSTNLEIR